jgi:hypothetical protein
LLDNVFGGFIVIVVATSLLPIVADQTVRAQSGNVTGSADTIVGLVPFFFSLSILAVGIGMTVGALRQSGAL